MIPLQVQGWENTLLLPHFPPFSPVGAENQAGAQLPPPGQRGQAPGPILFGAVMGGGI